MTEDKFTPPTAFPTEYVTRDGRTARIVAKFNGSVNKYAAVITGTDGIEFTAAFYENGAHASAEGFDLFDKPETVTLWYNVYPHRHTIGYATRSNADVSASTARLNVLRITTCKETGKLIGCVEEGI